ncbi:MAG: ATP-binding protein [Rhodobacteraceae bacterium]|nr:ATP-binding protein [Paracoccaceae bacterium]
MRHSFRSRRKIRPAHCSAGSRRPDHDHQNSPGRPRISAYSSWTDLVIGGFLDCLDGFNGLEGVVVVAATNHLYKTDTALRRPGQFDRLVSIDHPTQEIMPQA